MPNSTLEQLIMRHHAQARDMVIKTIDADRGLPYQGAVEELKRVGRKFTTRVERRLLKMESRTARRPQR